MLQGDENHFRPKRICSLDAISRRRVFRECSLRCTTSKTEEVITIKHPLRSRLFRAQNQDGARQLFVVGKAIIDLG
jgi:hypothetical protein